jgi:hypothetical protein
MSVIDDPVTTVVMSSDATRVVEEVAELRGITPDEVLSEAIGFYREVTKMVSEGARILVAKNNETTQEIVFPKKGN